MTVFLIPQSVLGQDGRTVIKTIDGTPMFIMIGKWGLGGNVLSIYSMSGDLLASVKKYPNALGTRFDLYENFVKVATMRKVFQLYFDFYFINHLNWYVLGNVYHHRYAIRNFSELILEMEVQKSFKGEYYCINIPNDANAPLALCIASVLDNWAASSFKEKFKKIKYATNPLAEV